MVSKENESDDEDKNNISGTDESDIDEDLNYIESENDENKIENDNGSLTSNDLYLINGDIFIEKNKKVQ